MTTNPKRSTMLALALATGVSLACGCTSWHLAEPAKVQVHPDAPAPATHAKICVVRTSVLAQAVTFPTRDNGVLVGATKGPTHFCYFAEPGAHAIDIEADEVEHASIDAQGGRTYFLKEDVDNILGWVKCRAMWVTPEIGKELLGDSTYEVLVSVPGSERLPGGVPVAPAKAAPRTAKNE
jgi:hypothetical protein